MFEGLLNSLFFWLRSRIRWKRSGYFPSSEPKDSLFKELPQLSQRADLLEERYHLTGFRDNSTILEYRETMFVLELLETALDGESLINSRPDFSEGNRGPLDSVLDVGSKNFAYARGLRHYFQFGSFHPRNGFQLTGIEIDPYPVYRDLYSRHDYACYHIRNLENTRYIGQNLLDHSEKHDVITWFLPFLNEYALVKWGLPNHFFQPRTLLEHAWRLLKPGGILIAANLETEVETQVGLMKELAIPFKYPKPFASPWRPLVRRHLILAIK